MKKILFIIFTFISSLTFGQQSLSKVATLASPKKSKILLQSEGQSYITSNFKLLPFPKVMSTTYQIGDILVSFQDFTLPYAVSLKSFEERAYDLSEPYYNRKIVWSGKIQKFKYQDFYVKTLSKGDESFIWFISESKELKGVEGYIAFKQKDAEKAKMTLEDLLNSIQLK
ncbi:hypothetical protein ACJVDH_15390 [Pedobacter sp. AW1-32]|uniref:hypothetical protein n=1 Tax=Pedobacter sp. AW1-32 TaxID=3383026 RepID=UPI003FEEBCF4